MWYLSGIVGIIAHVVCFSEANAPLIERWIMKKALGGALAVERFFILRDRAGLAVSFAQREGLVAQAEKDVEEFVDAMIEVHVNEEEAVKLRRMYFSNRYWEFLALLQDDDDPEALFLGMGKRFSSFLNYMRPRLGGFVEMSASVDLLGEKKIYEVLERSVFNDMFDIIRMSDGEFEMDGKRLTLRARAATSLLAKITFELVNSNSTSPKTKRLIVESLLEVASANGLNEVFFTNTARGEIVENDPDYRRVDRFVKKQIVEFSKIVESVVESTNLAETLKTARLDWLENPKKLI